MGKFSRDKGARFERDIVAFFRDKGYDAERVPLSGAAGGSFAGDVIVETGLGKLTVECKKRARGFTSLYEWLEDNSLLVCAQDRRAPLAVMRLEDFGNLLLMLDREVAANEKES